MDIEDMSIQKYLDVVRAMGRNSNDTHSVIMQRVNTCIELMPTPVDVMGITSPDGSATWSGNRWVYKQELLIDKVFDNPAIMDMIFEGSRITAIKELRTVTKCGLKDAKEAVESTRVQTAINFRKQDLLAALQSKLAGPPLDTPDDPWYGIGNDGWDDDPIVDSNG